MAARLEEVRESDEIGVDIGAGIFERVANAGLGSEMDHLGGPVRLEQPVPRIGVGEVQALEPEQRLRFEHAESRLLEGAVAVGREVVDANDRPPELEEAPRNREADKASGAGDEGWSGSGHALTILGLASPARAQALRVSMTICAWSMIEA